MAHLSILWHIFQDFIQVFSVLIESAMLHNSLLVRFKFIFQLKYFFFFFLAYVKRHLYFFLQNSISFIILRFLVGESDPDGHSLHMGHVIHIAVLTYDRGMSTTCSFFFYLRNFNRVLVPSRSCTMAVFLCVSLYKT